MDVKKKREKEEELKKTVCSFFDTILETNESKLAELQKDIRKPTNNSSSISSEYLFHKE
jgi:hypothetical protein